MKVVKVCLNGFRYLLVIMDNLSIFVSLKPAEACTAEVTAKHLLKDYGGAACVGV